MNILTGIEQIAVTHISGELPLYSHLYVGHMDLIAALLRAQNKLHESNYDPLVRSALVGPAHTAVMDSAIALAKAATGTTV